MRAAESFHRLEIPTCLPIGEVNVYLIEGTVPALIDTGPKTQEAYEALTRELRKLGLSIKDIGRVLITHGHVDHHGLADVIRRDSKAEILAPEGDADIVRDFKGAFKSKHAEYSGILLRTGIPPETLELVEGFFEYLATLAEATSISSVVKEGDLIDIGARRLKAIHTPGHSPGSMCYLDAEGSLFSGDTLIKDIVPVSAFGSAEGKSIGLSDYLASVSKLEKLEVASVKPGHRAEFKDVAACTALVHSQFESRQSSIMQVLRGESCTACDLVDRLFGILPIQDVFLALTEVLGHLEILTAEGKVRCEERDEVDYYSIA
jgi:glyoxylase-like metal-dependent hydrolase (beta-lactamase superfamily II)